MCAKVSWFIARKSRNLLISFRKDLNLESQTIYFSFLLDCITWVTEAFADTDVVENVDIVFRSCLAQMEP